MKSSTFELGLSLHLFEIFWKYYPDITDSLRVLDSHDFVQISMEFWSSKRLISLLTGEDFKKKVMKIVIDGYVNLDTRSKVSNRIEHWHKHFQEFLLS